MSGLFEAIRSIDVWLFRLGNAGAQNALFDAVMPYITSSAYVLPPLLALIAGVLWRGSIRDQICVLLAVAAVGISDQSVNALKNWAQRPRPCRDLVGARLLTPCGKGASFPSAHAANNATVATVFTLCYRRRGKYLFAWAALASYSRVYCGVHYVSDIAIGALIGAFIALGVCFFYRKFVPKRSFLYV
jgi:undecaprenyl-diphosphatase